MTASNSDSDLVFIGDSIQRMVSTVEHAIAIEELSRAALNRDDPYSRLEALRYVFSGTTTEPTLFTIMGTIARDLTLCVTKIHDGPGQKRASINEILRKLEKPETLAAFLKYTEDPFTKRSGQETLNDIKIRWEEIRADHKDSLTRLFAARDTYAAHLLVKEPELPLYRELFDLVDRTASVVGDLAALHGSYRNGFTATREIQRRRAIQFWDMLIAGGLTKFC